MTASVVNVNRRAKPKGAGGACGQRVKFARSLPLQIMLYSDCVCLPVLKHCTELFKASLPGELPGIPLYNVSGAERDSASLHAKGKIIDELPVLRAACARSEPALPHV